MTETFFKYETPSGCNFELAATSSLGLKEIILDIYKSTKLNTFILYAEIKEVIKWVFVS